MDIAKMTAVELGRKIKAKEISVREAVEAVFDRIKSVESEYNCYVTLCEEQALKKAEEIQKKIDDGTLTGPLAGVPVAIKDNMCTEGVLTTCSSKILYNFKPTFSSEAVLNLEKAGAIIIGKTNMDEFAMGSTTETSFSGQQRILGIRSMFREVHREVRLPPSLPTNASMRSARTLAAQSDSQAHTAELSE